MPQSFFFCIFFFLLWHYKWCIVVFLFYFQSLRKVGQDPIVLLMCITVFLSYLPEAGQYSCMFIYLKQVSHSNSFDYWHALPTTPDQFFSCILSDQLVLMASPLNIFLSFLFQVIHFTAEDVATFIAVLGVLSVISQVNILIKKLYSYNYLWPAWLYKFTLYQRQYT